jgi:hypothetical protein
LLSTDILPAMKHAMAESARRQVMAAHFVFTCTNEVLTTPVKDLRRTGFRSHLYAAVD